MTHLIAIDWDSHELRAVAGRTASGGITLTDTGTIPLDGDGVAEVTKAIQEMLTRFGIGKGKSKLLVAIGRGKAELRQLTLPPVPENELPALVRFQALQSFSASGDAVAVDFLPVEVTEQSTSVIAGGVPPATMKQIGSIADAVGLELKRVVLRPVAAAALYSLKADGGAGLAGDCVLVDMLADDAEIVVFRAGKVVFVRSVRMPEQMAGRTSQIAGEIRRSLMACGTDSAGESHRVLIWGQAKTHENDVQQLRELLKCDVQTIDPIAMVNVDSRRAGGTSGASAADGHTGRLAPLVGLLAADAAAESADGHSALLVDFLNPRKMVEIRQDNRFRIGAAVAVVAATILLSFLGWSSLRSYDREIALRQAELALLNPQVTKAEEAIARTQRVDQFLDSSVVWLDELRRVAERMPQSDQALLKSVNAVSLPREGGGKLNLTAAAKSPVVVDEMESALRDDEHSVTGTGANDLGSKELYRWGFSQSVTVAPETIRDQRYEAFSPPADDAAETAETEASQAAEKAEPPAADDDETAITDPTGPAESATTGEPPAEQSPDVTPEPDTPQPGTPETVAPAEASEATTESTTETPVDAADETGEPTTGEEQ